MLAAAVTLPPPPSIATYPTCLSSLYSLLSWGFFTTVVSPVVQPVERTYSGGGLAVVVANDSSETDPPHTPFSSFFFGRRLLDSGNFLMKMNETTQLNVLALDMMF